MVNVPIPVTLCLVLMLATGWATPSNAQGILLGGRVMAAPGMPALVSTVSLRAELPFVLGWEGGVGGGCYSASCAGGPENSLLLFTPTVRKVRVIGRFGFGMSFRDFWTHEVHLTGGVEVRDLERRLVLGWQTGVCFFNYSIASDVMVTTGVIGIWFSIHGILPGPWLDPVADTGNQ